jgi:hypothetical protein
MKPSFFDVPEDLGATLYRRFYVPIEQRKFVVVGVPPRPDWHVKIVRGILQAAASENKPFEVILADSQMPALDLSGLPPAQMHLVTMGDATQAAFADAAREARASGKRVLVYTASVYSSHVLQGNPIHRYEKMTGENLLSITTAPLALSSSEEHVVDPPCIGGERDTTGLAPLGCVILSSGRGYYRKKIKSDRFVAIMNSPAADDYLLMVAAPEQGLSQ